MDNRWRKTERKKIINISIPFSTVTNINIWRVNSALSNLVSLALWLDARQHTSHRNNTFFDILQRLTATCLWLLCLYVQRGTAFNAFPADSADVNKCYYESIAGSVFKVTGAYEYARVTPELCVEACSKLNDPTITAAGLTQKHICLCGKDADTAGMATCCSLWLNQQVACLEVEWYAQLLILWVMIFSVLKLLILGLLALKDW